MKMFDACWHWDGAAYTDKTSTAHSGMALTVSTGDEIYFAFTDWIAGVLFYLSTAASDADYTVEIWNGEEWKAVVPEYAFEATATGAGYTWEQAYNFAGHGVAYWGKNPDVWRLGTSSSTWPESLAPPTDELSRYWVRITFSSVSGTLVLDKVFPLPYNSYATLNHVAQFMGWKSFGDITSPTAAVVRHCIRGVEDWLDHFCRKTWRIRGAFREPYDFNPYGIRLNHQPPLFVTRLGMWQGNTFTAMTQGRAGGGNGEYWLHPQRGMVYFNLPSFRLRYYSFLLSRYLRQPGSIVVDYVYGTDFETHEQAQTVTHIVLRLVGAELVRNADDTGLTSSGLDVLSKADKVDEWQEWGEAQAEHLRGLGMTGLGMGGW